MTLNKFLDLSGSMSSSAKKKGKKAAGAKTRRQRENRTYGNRESRTFSRVKPPERCTVKAKG